jgi:Cu-Zn family superoxide dismutase
MKWQWAALIAVGMAAPSPRACAETGRAVIQATSDGSAVDGSAVLMDKADGLEVTVQVSGVSPGKHGLHVHEFGSCADGGKAAGSHYNPDGVAHGFLPSDGLAKAHPGDLGNLEVAEDGTGILAATLPGVRLSGSKYSVGGRAIVLHEKLDDFGQPTGNAGGRIGCGPIIITKE